MSKSTLTQLDPLSKEFAAWLKTPGFRKPTATVMHHTAVPTAAQYRGLSTIKGIRAYHVGKGWSDIAAQGYACPDGTVFTARPLDVANYCHAYIVRNKPLGNLANYWHGDRQYLNCTAPAFGLETVANFTSENPWVPGSLAAKSLECALRVLTVVHRTFNIPAEKCFFHRQAEAKDCPGTRLDLDEFRAELARRIGAVADKSAKVVGPDNKVIECDPQMVGGEMTVAAAPLLDAIGVPLTAIRPGVIHANGRAYVGALARDCAGWAMVLRYPAQGVRLYVKRVA
jgi:hypothetical protein